MSAPAIKSSMPGVGTPTASTGHTMLPMNMVAQKVVPSTDQSSGGMKPLQGTNLNYVTLQPASQPLSLIQEHRAPSYPAPFANNIPVEQQQQQPPQPQPQQQQPQQQHKEAEQPHQDQSKLVQNGTDQSKVEKDKPDGLAVPVPPVATPAATVSVPTPATTPAATPAVPANVAPVSVASGVTNATIATSAASAPPATTVVVPATPPVVKPAAVEQPKVNSSSVDGPAQERPQETETTPKPKEEPTPVKPEQVPVPVTQNKVEEKKSPVTSGPKEESTPTNTSPQKPTQPPATQKEEISPKVETVVQKSPKTSVKPVEIPEKTELKDVKTPVSSRPAKRKSRELKEPKSGGSSDGGPRSKRNRVQTTPYQSPLPDIAAIVKNLSKSSPRGADDKLIVFYKNEFLAVRNTEGSFYVCQAMQNIYKSSKRIRIRWLSQDKNNGEIYSPDFYDLTEFDCILTNLNLNKVEKNKYQLTKYELLRTENILKRAIDVEAGVSEKPRVTEEHPDGLDLSLYTDEAQLKKRKGKGKGGKGKGKRQRKKAKDGSDSEEDDDDDETDDDIDDEDDSSSESDSSGKKSSPSGRKSSQAKKRSGSKAAIVQAPSTPKGPSRAERALNRSKGVGPSTSAASSSGPSMATTIKKAVEPKKVSEPVVKKALEPKQKQVVKPAPSTSTNTPVPARVKARASTVALTPMPETKPPGGRPKRVASTTTVTPPSTEDSSSRKKPRGRA